jgi:hypothetical protein
MEMTTFDITKKKMKLVPCSLISAVSLIVRLGITLAIKLPIGIALLIIVTAVTLYQRISEEHLPLSRQTTRLTSCSLS